MRTLGKHVVLALTMVTTLAVAEFAASAADVAPVIPQGGLPALDNARRSAAEALVRAVAALELNNGGAVGDLLKGETPRASVREILAGVEEQQPVRFYDDRTCVVEWRITTEQLDKNLAAIAAKVNGEGEAAELKLKSPPAEPLRATGTYEEPRFSYELQPAGGGMSTQAKPRRIPWPPHDLQGWGGADLDEVSTLQAARQALARAREKVKAEVMAMKLTEDVTVAGFLEGKEEAAKGFDSFLNLVRPAWLAYLTGGVVEVDFKLPAKRALGELTVLNRALPDEQARLDEKVFIGLQETMGETAFEALGCASVVAATATPEPPAEQYAPLPDDLLPPLSLAFLETLAPPTPEKGTENVENAENAEKAAE